MKVQRIKLRGAAEFYINNEQAVLFYTTQLFQMETDSKSPWNLWGELLLIPSYLSWKLIHKMWTTCEQMWKEKWIHVNKARYYRAVFYVDKWMKLFNYSHKMVRDTGLWGFWSHHHLLLLPGHSSLFSRFRVRGVVAASPQIIYGAMPEGGIQVTSH